MTSPAHALDTNTSIPASASMPGASTLRDRLKMRPTMVRRLRYAFDPNVAAEAAKIRGRIDGYRALANTAKTSEGQLQAQTNQAIAEEELEKFLEDKEMLTLVVRPVEPSDYDAVVALCPTPEDQIESAKRAGEDPPPYDTQKLPLEVAKIAVIRIESSTGETIDPPEAEDLEALWPTMLPGDRQEVLSEAVALMLSTTSRLESVGKD